MRLLAHSVMAFRMGSSDSDVWARGTSASAGYHGGLPDAGLSLAADLVPKDTGHADHGSIGQLRAWSVVSRWKRKMGMREAYYLVRYTLIGKMWVLLGLVALPSLFGLVVDDHFKQLSTAPGQLEGLLVAANVALVICFVTILPPLFAKVFVLKTADEPLAAHPFAAPALALHRLLTATLMTAGLYLLTFHYIFFGHALRNRLDNPWIGLPIHLLTSLGFLLAIGVLTGAICRALLRRRGMVRRADFIFRLGGAVFVGTFAGSLAVLNLVMKNAPEWFETLGEIAGRSHHLFLVPLIAALSTNGGNWLGPIIWLPAAAVAAWFAVRAAVTWSRVAQSELPLDLDAPAKRHYPSLFTGSCGWIRPWRWVMTFWRKDVLAPYMRDPRRYLSEQWFVFSAEIGAVVVVAVLRHRGVLGAAQGSALLVAVLLTSIAALAMLRGLNTLGTEGSQVGLLRSVMMGGELFLAKGLSSGLYVGVHGLLHSLVLMGSAQIAGIWNGGFLLPLVLVVSSALLLTLAACALGFSLPDFQRRAVFLPGASTLAKHFYAGVAALVVAFVALSHLQFAQERIDLATYAGLLSFVAAVVAASFSGVAWWAVSRLQRIEI